ncbi:putative hydro-lyase [Paenibacillus solisilvae]|uniref:Putative hydro-lyase ACFPYJ_14660 n=1 Tax=Paenibacillus solisilvae TaxID=2486751 RepID=A0ABW0W007_9BACL
MRDLRHLPPEEARMRIRERKHTTPTTGISIDYAQANLVVLNKEAAYDFLLFCTRNPKPCPLLDVTEAGSPVPMLTAPGADLRTDIPKYNLYRHGKLIEQTEDITSYWQDDLVAFLLGCSFTFEKSLLENDIPVRQIELNRNVPMYKTNIPCRPAGRFSGPMVVSMRPIPSRQVAKAVTVTSRYPSVHGTPIHIGNPALIGITDLDKPDYGDAVPLYEGEVPVFWACGVTPQAVAAASEADFMITHAPGHMFITDVKDQQLSLF